MLFLLLIPFVLCAGQIQMICTSALIENQFERRKLEYLSSLLQIRSLGFEPWVIECRNIGSSFFDDVTKQILYPQAHNDWLKNKGVNEALGIYQSVPCLPFDDEDIVIKLTGRYFLKDSHFIKLIESTQERFDVWGIFSGKHFVSPGHLMTGCFAMRWKHFKKMLEDLDYLQIELDSLPIEQVFADYIRENRLRVYPLCELHLWARVFYSGDAIEYEF